MDTPPRISTPLEVARRMAGLPEQDTPARKPRKASSAPKAPKKKKKRSSGRVPGPTGRGLMADHTFRQREKRALAALDSHDPTERLSEILTPDDVQEAVRRLQRRGFTEFDTIAEQRNGQSRFVVLAEHPKRPGRPVTFARMPEITT